MKSIRNKFLFIGTGGESGIPVHFCDCELCKLARGDKSFIKKPSTYLLNYKNKNIFLDIGSQEVLTRSYLNEIYIDAVFITHTHIDHTAGLFQLRWTRQKKLPIYYPEASEFIDGFDRLVLSPSFLGPFHEMKPFKDIKIDEVLTVTPLPLHHSIYTLGFFIEGDKFNIAHLPDTKGLPEKTMNFLKKREIDIINIDATYPSKWDLGDHNNLDEALDILSQLSFYKAFLVHVSHLHGSIEAITSKIEKRTMDLSGEVILPQDDTAVDLKAPFKVIKRVRV